MASYNIETLKADQDRLDERKDRLLNVVKPFCEGLVEALTMFTSKAAESGLRGVRTPKKERDTEAVLQVAFSLKEHDLVLATAYGAYFLEDAPNALASKLFLYHQGHPEDQPMAEIIIWVTKQADKELCAYEINWLLPETTLMRRGHTKAPQEAGKQAAKELIAVFYGFKRVWSEKRPTLRQLLEGRTESSIGFRVPSSQGQQ